jgi:hypothetical protein
MTAVEAKQLTLLDVLPRCSMDSVEVFLLDV